jgi:hypothetical protein
MVLATGLSALEGDDEVGLEIVMGEVALLRTAGDGLGTGVCPVTTVAMATKGTSMRCIDNFFPEELPFGTFRVGKTCFTAMTIIENYHFTLHTDRDLCNSMISWFLEGKCSLPHTSILNTSSFLKKKKFVQLHPNATIVNLVRA